jgi:hypothetical protein
MGGEGEKWSGISEENLKILVNGSVLVVGFRRQNGGSGTDVEQQFSLTRTSF